jgi:hypothetical protein
VILLVVIMGTARAAVQLTAGRSLREVATGQGAGLYGSALVAAHDRLEILEVSLHV